MPESETQTNQGGTARAEGTGSIPDDSIDAVLEATFPASDAPPWWSGRPKKTEP